MVTSVTGTISPSKTITGSMTRTSSAPPAPSERVVVDDALDPESENPVQNRVITAALDKKQDSDALGMASVTDIAAMFTTR